MWRDRAGTIFNCEKTPVTAARGMVVTNHPLASTAAAEMLASRGNAIDATVAALFTLTVVEPMMVGIFGGGTALIRLAASREVVIDGLSTAPAMTRPDSEIEKGFPEAVRSKLAGLGHPVVAVDHVAGGMAAIDFGADGTMTGAACWRADGTPLGRGGGLARKDTHFFTDPRGLAARAKAAATAASTP